MLATLMARLAVKFAIIPLRLPQLGEAEGARRRGGSV
jgi:hypothetical protein